MTPARTNKTHSPKCRRHGLGHWPGLIVASVFFLHCVAAPAAEVGSPAERGIALAAQLRAQRPAEEFTTSGLLRQRDATGRWKNPISVRFEVRLGADSWQSIYRAVGPGDRPQEVLVVTRQEARPNRYEHWRASDAASGATQGTSLSGDGAAIPFAGSEFWLSDLGLEFLQWPSQKWVGNQMRKGRACHVLESVNPSPQGSGYARVLSWIDVEHSGLLRAEAYDAHRRLVKEFNIGSFKKIEGKWQLKSMEIRNEQTDARTRLEFDLEIQD